MQHALHLDSQELQWAFTAATLPAGAVLLIGGTIADRYGARRVFLAGLFLFTAASAIGGCASSAGMLLAGRFGQGLGAGLLVPAALALITTTFPSAVSRARALAVWSSISAIGATSGLVLGGQVTTSWGWRWVLLGNVPVGVGLVVASVIYLPAERYTSTPRRVDVAGLLSFTAGVGFVIAGLSAVARAGLLAAVSIVPLALGLCLLGLFVWIERRVQNPALPIPLLSQRDVAPSIVALLGAGLAVDGLLFAFSTQVQVDLHFSAATFGMLASGATLTSALAAWVASRAATAVSPLAVAGTGLVLLVGACLLFAVTPAATSPLLLALALVLFGAGMGSTYVGGTVALMHGASQESGATAALQNISFTLGSVIGVALFAATINAKAFNRSTTQVTDALTASYLVGAGVLTLTLTSFAYLHRRPGARFSAK